MDVRTCKKCKRLFKYYGNDKCPECVIKLEEQFEEVKTILYKEPDCSMEELCEKTGADEDDILFWIRDGRLTVGTFSNAAVKCSSCGKNISSGRYCDDCKKSMVAKLEKGANSMIKENPNIFQKSIDNSSDRNRSRMYSRDDK